MRVVIRDKLAGVDVPLDVRGFIGTVWAQYMTSLRQARGIESDDYADAVETLDDMLCYDLHTAAIRPRGYPDPRPV